MGIVLDSVMKVLVIFPGRSALGGMTSVATQHITWMKENNFSVIEIETTSSSSFLYKLCNGVLAFFRLFMMVVLSRPDLAAVHYASRSSFYRKSLFIIFLRLFNIKTCLHLHGGAFVEFYKSSGSFVKWYIKNTLRLGSSHYVLGTIWKEFFRDELMLDDVDILPNAYAFDVSKNSTNTVRDIDVLFVGRVERAKGVYDLIEAVDNTEADIRLVFVGRILEHGLSGSKFIGELSRFETLEYMSRSKVLCLPSYVEAFPVVVLEAINCGALVVCSNVGAIKDILGSNYPFIFDSGDTIRLSEILSEIFQDYELARESVSAKYIECKERYDSSILSRKLIEDYVRIGKTKDCS